MTSARSEGERVIITHRRHVDVDRYIEPMLQLKHAKAERDRLTGQVTRAERKSYDDALAIAEAAVEKLFEESLWIDEAERLYGHLGGSIIQAKAQRGDFNRGDEVDEPIHRQADMVRRNIEHRHETGRL